MPPQAFFLIGGCWDTYRSFGNVRNRERTERPKNVTNDENSFNIMLDVTEKPKTSVQLLALNHKMGRNSVKKILKREKYHPYKIHLLQELSEDDFDRRIEFCEIMADRLYQYANFINQLVFSDESSFYLNGNVNRHNCRYW